MILYEGINNLTWFMGIVQRINDPKNEGRVKVRAFGFHPTIAEGTVTADDLPWASVLVNNVNVSAKLAIGELVFGAFLDGRDAQQPLIFGAIPTPKFGIPTLEPAGPPGLVGDERALGQAGSVNPASFPANGVGPLSQTDMANLQRAMLQRESSGNYQSINGYGYAGGYQFGALALQDLGYVKSGTTNAMLNDPNVWTGKNSVGSLDSFLNAPTIQDQAFVDYSQINYDRLIQNGTINGSSSTDDVAGYIAASHLLGAGGVNSGLSNSDANGTTGYEYYNIGSTAINSGSAQARAGMELPATAPYTPLVSETIESYGQGALPPQRTGEGIHHTPLAPALSSFQRERSPVIHPGLAVGSSYNTTVINASYNGSYIEMHGGDGENNEHINIVHKSGAHIALDQNGNVTIGAIGRLHVVSLNDFEQQIGGHTTNISDGGYSVRVENGGIQLHSVGDLSISSNSNINIAAAGDIVLNSGTSLDISSARVGLSATAGGVGVLSSEGIQLQSVGDTTVKGANFVVNAGTVGMKATNGFVLNAGTVGMEATGGNATIKGTQVRLNDGSVGSVATVADTQGAVGVEKPPTSGIATKKVSLGLPGGNSANQIDDPIAS